MKDTTFCARFNMDVLGVITEAYGSSRILFEVSPV